MKNQQGKFSSSPSYLGLVAFALGLLASPLAAGQQIDPNSCRGVLNDAAVTAEACSTTNHERLLRISIARLSSPMVVEAMFEKTSGDGTGQFWRRLSVVSGDGVVTKEEQLALRAAILKAGPDTIDKNARSVIDFLANFLEPDTKLEPFDRPASQRGFGRTGSGFTLICDAVGKDATAHFTAYGQTFDVVRPVGQPDTNCRGRCGLGCDEPFQYHQNQYTQECLNHDSCRDQTGQQFGQCEDEFWAAVEGYLSAPDCLIRMPRPFVPGVPPLELP